MIKQKRLEHGLKQVFEGRMVKSTIVEYSKSNQVNFKEDKFNFLDEFTTIKDEYMTYAMSILQFRAKESKNNLPNQKVITRT